MTKCVKNHPVLYVINSGVVEETWGSWLGFYNLYNFAYYLKSLSFKFHKARV